MSNEIVMKENVILDKSFSFAVKIVNLYKQLSTEQREFVLSKQLVKSGTSIGANAQEGVGGYSKKDFRAKMSIAYKESRETKYWLNLLNQTGYISEEQFKILHSECDELAKILFSILKNSKE